MKEKVSRCVSRRSHAQSGSLSSLSPRLHRRLPRMFTNHDHRRTTLWPVAGDKRAKVKRRLDAQTESRGAAPASPSVLEMGACCGHRASAIRSRIKGARATSRDTATPDNVSRPLKINRTAAAASRDCNCRVLRASRPASGTDI
ncbi:hypothetical protein LSAT2_019841 [Lamellibrachia satsuma]|nr:hypothetical protein LSAT2_019841 [Lamellibrachia satsuma]